MKRLIAAPVTVYPARFRLHAATLRIIAGQIQDKTPRHHADYLRRIADDIDPEVSEVMGAVE